MTKLFSARAWVAPMGADAELVQARYWRHLGSRHPLGVPRPARALGNDMTDRLIVTPYDAWAPPTDEPCSSEDYVVTMLALYAIAATVAVIGVTLWGWARGRGR